MVPAVAAETSTDRLRRLLRSEIAKPMSCIDQINTVIWQDFIEEKSAEHLIAVLHQLLGTDPTLITALNRAAMSEDGDWIELLNDGLPESDQAKRVADFVDVARAASNVRLTTISAGFDQMDNTDYMVRLWMQPIRDGRRSGAVCLDFRHHNSAMPACYDCMSIGTADYPTLLLQLICTLPDLELRHVEDRRKSIRQGPMFHYHPERMRATRAYLKGMRPLSVAMGKPAMMSASLQALGDAIIGEIRDTHMEYPLADLDGADFMTPVYREVDLAGTWLAYAGAGREIFDVPPRLADMFALSDCDDIQLAQVRTPYVAQYVHFGLREDLEMAPGWRCDGAYVLAANGCMTVRLTTMPSDPAELMDWRVRAEPVVVFNFEAADQQLDVGTAVDTAVARSIQHLRSEAAGAPGMQEEANAAAQQLGLPGGIKVVSAERAAQESAEILRTREMGHRALSLVVNALCYLTAYPDDVEHRWPKTAPPGLLEQLEGGTPGRRKRAEQQLHSEGFSKIRLCGRAFRSGHGSQSVVDMGSVRSHWRRGHFRSQVHGQGRQLRKLVWIMPVLVNAAAMTEQTQMPGHLYIVDVNAVPAEGRD